MNDDLLSQEPDATDDLPEMTAEEVAAFCDEWDAMAEFERVAAEGRN